MTYQTDVAGPNTNFANADLNLTGDRLHDVLANTMRINVGTGGGLYFGGGDFITQAADYNFLRIGELFESREFVEGNFVMEYDLDASGLSYRISNSVDYPVGIAGALRLNTYVGVPDFPRVEMEDVQLHIVGGNGTPAAANAQGIILWQNAGELSVTDAAGNTTLLSSHSNYGMLEDQDFHPLDDLKHTVTHANLEKKIAQAEYNFLNKHIVAKGNMETGEYILYNENGIILREGISEKLKV